MTLSPEQQQREQDLVDQVVASFAQTPDPRLRELTGAVVRHLHAFLREVRLTEAEWTTAIEFLTAVGHITDDRRQEFILLSTEPHAGLTCSATPTAPSGSGR